MRISACLATSLFGATLALANPLVAAAQGEQTWQTCIGVGTAPDDRVLDRATADYAEVIRLAPTDARGWRNRGMIRLYKGDNKGGLADYDKAVQYDPADVFSWNNRGQARMRLGDKSGAIADFRKALELRPDLRSARDSLQQLGAAP